MFSRAIARGEIPADIDVEVAIDLLWGPLYHRLFHGHAPLNDRFARRSVDTVLAGILPRDDNPSDRQPIAPAHTGCPLTESATATLPRVAFEYGQR